MTPELFFFMLRLGLAAVLYAFLGTIIYLLWRDVRTATETASARQRRLGQLTALSDSVAGEGAARVYPLLPITSLGRAPTNMVTLSDEAVSLEHALLVLRGGQWWLEDLGSRNGTTLNGAPVAQPVVVSAGDVIGIGKTRLKLELE
ncbi:MAG: FHA domain-containing protein [Chloroflexi bacterium]|nr:FHA domain-containing protein [Chloroflexota bacterium]